MENDANVFIAGTIISLFTGIICVVIAESKGIPKSKNGLWFAVGFFLNLLGIIITLLQSKQMAGFVETGKMKLCPYCKEPVQAEAILCKHCRSTLEPIKQGEA